MTSIQPLTASPPSHATFFGVANVCSDWALNGQIRQKNQFLDFLLCCRSGTTRGANAQLFIYIRKQIQTEWSCVICAYFG